MRVALDTTTLVRGVLSPHAPEGRLVDLVVAEVFTLLYDDRLLHEYRSALSDTALGLPVAAVDQLIDFVAATGVRVTVALQPEPPNRPLALAVASDGCADALVTDQAGAYPAGRLRGGRAYTAAGFLATLDAADSDSPDLRFSLPGR